MASLPIAVLGTGSYAPPKVLNNTELSTLVETSDEWITSRTGIKERRIASAEEQTSDLATKAAQAALADAGLTAADVDLVIVATVTPDMPMPACATIVQAKLGITNRATSFDLNAACSGFIYALDTAWAMLSSGRYRHALVIGAEKLSSVLDWKDRTTCVLFGDGAGAVVLGPSRNGTGALVGAKLYCEGGMQDLLSINPKTASATPDQPLFLKMKGREVFKVAVRQMEESIHDILEQHQIKAEQIDSVIPHQANQRIIDALAKSLGLPADRFVVNLDRFGNTSAASIPLALDEAKKSGRIKAGDTSLLVAFGAGLTYGAALVRW